MKNMGILTIKHSLCSHKESILTDWKLIQFNLEIVSCRWNACRNYWNVSVEQYNFNSLIWCGNLKTSVRYILTA